MHIDLSVLKGTPLDPGWIRKPFVTTTGFRDSWWLEQAQQPLNFYIAHNAEHGEVARVQVSLSTTSGDAYPTWTRPDNGGAEIDLLEVRSDLRGQSIGTATIERVQSALAVPLIAISLNAASDAFWRALGWTEHLHEDVETDDDDRDDSASLLFASPTN
ncbi:MAG: hypothetical protein JWN84_2344 [Nocardioides sp.]|nr:hypothetical protein [Nocardioides sp.]